MNRLRLFSLLGLLLFCSSFFMPVYGGNGFLHLEVGWQVALGALKDAFRSDGPEAVSRLKLLLFDLSNVVTPVLLILIACDRLKGRLGVWLVVLAIVSVVNASQLLHEQLLSGYWMWFGSQLVAVVLAVWRWGNPVHSSGAA